MWVKLFQKNACLKTDSCISSITKATENFSQIVQKFYVPPQNSTRQKLIKSKFYSEKQKY